MNNGYIVRLQERHNAFHANYLKGYVRMCFSVMKPFKVFINTYLTLLTGYYIISSKVTTIM